MAASSSAERAQPAWRVQAESIRWNVHPFIDGDYRSSATDDTYDDVDPSTETALCQPSIGHIRDVDEAVASARRCFEEGSWSQRTPTQRADVLHGLADLLVGHKAELALLDSLEVGKPIQTTLWDVEAYAAPLLRSWSSAAEQLLGSTLPLTPGRAAFNVWEARGVVAGITAWNFPVVNAIFKLGPALAAGNSVVLKPSELSPSSALKVAELALEAGLPPGALNVVPGLGATVGAALASHKDVDFLTFTGSTATGKQIMEHAARSNATPLILECGGKSPQVVTEDVQDLGGVAAATLQDAFFNTGQVCTAHTRLIFHRAIKDELLEQLLDGAGEYVPGPPLDDSTTFGPLASPEQRDRVKGHIERGLAAGAEAVLRGDIQESGGCYVSPTIFDGVTGSMSIAQEEIFGPVLCVQSFSSDDEAIALANGTDYALTATVWTSDLGRAKRLARAIKSGSIVVRSSGDEIPDSDLQSETILGYQPRKGSGFGAELGIEGLKSYSSLKAIYLDGT